MKEMRDGKLELPGDFAYELNKWALECKYSIGGAFESVIYTPFAKLFIGDVPFPWAMPFANNESNYKEKFLNSGKSDPEITLREMKKDCQLNDVRDLMGVMNLPSARVAR